jgi:hypothetical protein
VSGYAIRRALAVTLDGGRFKAVTRQGKGMERGLRLLLDFRAEARKAVR